MFTFSELGNMGKLGNQLFQIAATIGTAVRHGQDYVFPAWPNGDYFKTPIPQTSEKLRPDIVLGQYSFHYLNVEIATNAPCLIDMRGFFQSERYFLHVSDRIRDHFAPNPRIVDHVMQDREDLLRGEPCIIVVRRAGYAKTPLEHPMMPAEYYQRAMSLFPEDTAFVVTSDDVEWCKKNLRARNIIFLPQETGYLNFFTGTMCRNAIIANSTFGWWIAWLMTHADKRVIAPKEWFGPRLAHLATSDLLPCTWETI